MFVPKSKKTFDVTCTCDAWKKRVREIMGLTMPPHPHPHTPYIKKNRAIRKMQDEKKFSNQDKEQTQITFVKASYLKNESMGDGKLKSHQKPMGINGEIVNMSYAGPRAKWGKWESLRNGKIETLSKHQKKIMCNDKT